MLKQRNTIKTKKGAASLFIVIFTIILLGVITLGFTRIMLSDASQTSNNDLSQSAYDSALAGVEDAKVALLKYHQCLYTHDDSQECAKIRQAMENGMRDGSCDIVANVLGRKSSSENGETPIRETTSGNSNSNYMDQAYTCVTIQENLSDYRSTIGTDLHTRLVPLQAANTSDVQKIQFKWYVPSNYNNVSSSNINNNFAPASSETINQPPLVALQFVQTDTTFQLSELTASYDANRTDRSTIYLKPSSEDKYKNTVVSASEMAASANKSQDSTSNKEPHRVYCDKQASDFACSVTLELPRTFQNSTNRHPDAFFIVVSLPYGQPETDFAVQMQKANGEVVAFNGAQARVDSTGRANELYRRVESRIELTDVYFPYPEYAIQLSGGDNGGDINKNYYVTDNCWNSNNGNMSNCKNSKNL